MREGGFGLGTVRKMQTDRHSRVWVQRRGQLQAGTHRDSAQDYGCQKGCRASIQRHLQGDVRLRLRGAKREAAWLCRRRGALLPLLLLGWGSVNRITRFVENSGNKSKIVFLLVLPNASYAAKCLALSSHT